MIDFRLSSWRGAYLKFILFCIQTFGSGANFIIYCTRWLPGRFGFRYFLKHKRKRKCLNVTNFFV